MALTTVARVKTEIGLKADDSQNNAKIAELIERVSSVISGECGRTFEYQQFTEYFNGDGASGTVNLTHYPFDSSAAFSLYDDTERAYGASTLIATADYIIDDDTGILTLDGNLTFSRGKRNIKVTYYGGYKVIPQDLEMAAIMRVYASFLQSQGTLNVHVDQEQANRISAMKKEATATINRYKNMSF